VLRLVLWYLAIAAVALVIWYPYGATAKRSDKENEKQLNDMPHY